jgi:hypothetical protein
MMRLNPALLALCVVCVGLLDGRTASAQVTERPRYAVLIGVGDYGHGVQRLPATRNDVAAMRHVLERSYNFDSKQILEIQDAAATRDSVITAIRGHLGRAQPSELALLYFVGHGVQVNGNLSVPDFEPSGVDQALRVYGKTDNVLLDDEIAVLVERLASDRVLVIVDACYSGSIAFSKREAQANKKPQAGRVGAALVEVGKDVSYDLPDRYESDGVPLASIPDGMPGAAEISPYMIMAGTTDESGSFSGINWPDKKRPRSFFSYHIAIQLSKAESTWTVRRLSRATRRALEFDPLCQKHNLCQVPSSRGTALNGLLSELLDP